tara:strand:- start:28459 stop:28665 length:207 start_codon:yes stop_codon:yes gene_type:complete
VTKNDPKSWTYEEALENFDQFCDYFDAASSSAYSKHQRADSTPPRPDINASEATINVQATRSRETHED